jgi:hypothetical protein
MRKKTRPFGYPLGQHFPERRMLMGFEGGAVWLAENDGLYYVIEDEGTLADFIPDEDDDLLDMLINIYEFDSEPDRQKYLKERGWVQQDHE